MTLHRMGCSSTCRRCTSANPLLTLHSTLCVSPQPKLILVATKILLVLVLWQPLESKASLRLLSMPTNPVQLISNYSFISETPHPGVRADIYKINTYWLFVLAAKLYACLRLYACMTEHCCDYCTYE